MGSSFGSRACCRAAPVRGRACCRAAPDTIKGFNLRARACRRTTVAAIMGSSPGGRACCRAAQREHVAIVIGKGCECRFYIRDRDCCSAAAARAERRRGDLAQAPQPSGGGDTCGRARRGPRQRILRFSEQPRGGHLHFGGLPNARTPQLRPAHGRVRLHRSRCCCPPARRGACKSRRLVERRAAGLRKPRGSSARRSSFGEGRGGARARRGGRQRTRQVLLAPRRAPAGARGMVGWSSFFGQLLGRCAGRVPEQRGRGTRGAAPPSLESMGS